MQIKWIRGQKLHQHLQKAWNCCKQSAIFIWHHCHKIIWIQSMTSRLNYFFVLYLQFQKKILLIQSMIQVTLINCHHFVFQSFTPPLFANKRVMEYRTIQKQLLWWLVYLRNNHQIKIVFNSWVKRHFYNKYSLNTIYHNHKSKQSSLMVRNMDS